MYIIYDMLDRLMASAFYSMYLGYMTLHADECLYDNCTIDIQEVLELIQTLSPSRPTVLSLQYKLRYKTDQLAYLYCV